MHRSFDSKPCKSNATVYSFTLDYFQLLQLACSKSTQIKIMTRLTVPSLVASPWGTMIVSKATEPTNFEHIFLPDLFEYVFREIKDCHLLYLLANVHPLLKTHGLPAGFLNR